MENMTRAILDSESTYEITAYPLEGDSLTAVIRIEEDYSLDRPVVVVCGDAAQLQSMVMNLGINASQAMP